MLNMLKDIYAYYVKNTAITFEYDVPALAEFQRRMSHTLKKYPYYCITAWETMQVLGEHSKKEKPQPTRLRFISYQIEVT